MKAFLTIALLYLTSGCFCQTDTGRINRPIDYKALANFDFENVFKIDWPQSQPVPKHSATILTKEMVNGDWQAEALGSNWGGLQQHLIRPNKRLVLRNDSIFVYRNDSLERAATYRLVIPSTGYARQNKTLFVWADNKEQWQVILFQIGEHVPWQGIATKQFIWFNRQPNCACGCPEELYSRQIPL